MKKYLIIATAIFSMSSMVACSKFLERPVEDALTEEDAIYDEATLKSFLNGTYVNTATDLYSGNQTWIADLMGDEINGNLYSGDDGEFYNRKTSIFGAYKNDRYTAMNQIVYRANKIISRLDLATSDKDNVEGEAQFLRALARFEILKLWALNWGATADNNHLGIVLRNETSINGLNRSTIKESYDAVIADLVSALAKVKDTPAAGHAGKDQVKALLAKVYFQKNDFANAFKYADEVIKTGKYILDKDDTTPTGLKWTAKRYSEGKSTEMIFGFKYVLSVLEVGGELRGRYRSDVGFSPQGRFKASSVMYNLGTQTGDTRAAWYAPTQTDGVTYYPITKYDKDRFDRPVIHLTDLKLIRAESAAELGGANLAVAIADVNDILTRAFAGTSRNIATSATKNEVLTQVRAQRELEMIGEGDRLQQIKRIGALTGQTVDRRNAPSNCPGMAIQFPQGEKSGYSSFTMNEEGGCN
ncbi:RagB/SusD family nutrient uptake outer membrane protein [Polluticaenibacter yanchengensis]|uniref:RagB/SusD family nutrient uptake outer membrane protein n=1 Tax=Polluticaenibacter yanchengensis TaxID=3014562 RepID=A0ABT4ULW0_9BACT|nr:RagB/SusD family nutrient uptake outer membrane protein [Chitinophagaceae bacterium LY-5]